MNVWLLRQHIQTIHPSTKLDHKTFEKFNMWERIGIHVYCLELPTSMTVYSIIHVFVVEPVHTNPLSRHLQLPVAVVIVDDIEEWNVDEILDSCIQHEILQYLVKWTGYDQASWKLAAHLDGNLASLQRFNSMNSVKTSVPPPNHQVSRPSIFPLRFYFIFVFPPTILHRPPRNCRHGRNLSPSMSRPCRKPVRLPEITSPVAIKPNLSTSMTLNFQ